MIPQLIIIVILICINAFFASAEMAFVSVNKNRIKVLSDQGDKHAILLEKVMGNQTKFLSTIQIGITLAGFFSSASAAIGIADDFQIILIKLNIPYPYQVAIILVTIVLSFFTLVFGELVPKRIALKKAEAIALHTVRPVAIVSVIASPFISLLSLSTNLVIRLLGFNQNDSDEDILEEEIWSIIETSHSQGNINKNEKEMIQSVFKFNDKIVRDIMAPRVKVFLLDINEPLENNLIEIMEENFSRIPVYEQTKDNIIGMLYQKDLLESAFNVGFDKINLRSLLRDAYFVNEMKTVDKMYRELQKLTNHLAIVIDEFGSMSGIVTIEDLIEEIMGNIYDEFDEVE